MSSEYKIDLLLEMAGAVCRHVRLFDIKSLFQFYFFKHTHTFTTPFLHQITFGTRNVVKSLYFYFSIKRKEKHHRFRYANLVPTSILSVQDISSRKPIKLLEISGNYATFFNMCVCVYI